MRRILLLLILIPVTLFGGTRLKNLVDIKGVRSQQLVGYGIVVGLAGTGDGQGALFTIQSISNMLSQMGVKVNPARLKVKNAAAVMVTASLPPFAEAGAKVDINVSSLGDAKSLSGGTLLMTPLKGPDGRVYVVGQGEISVGGYGAGGKTKNHLTTGRVPEGGIVERSLSTPFVKNGTITLMLKKADFTTAFKVTDSINRYFAKKLATSLDGREIRVGMMEGFDPIKMVAFLEQIQVTPDRRAVIVLNERTGTVVMGGDIVVRETAISHGNLTITVKSDPYVSQPGPFSGGKTVTGERQTTEIEEEKRRLTMMKGGKISDLVEGLNSLGVTPRDLIGIIQALKKAGAIDAEIEVM